MRKFLFICLCACMALTSYAAPANTYSFEYEDIHTTILFEETTQWSAEQQQAIADLIVYGNPDDGISTCAACWIVGHNITSEAVYAVEHKVDVLSPRCLETTYQVDTCSSCDYVEITELCTFFIDCCPED